MHERELTAEGTEVTFATHLLNGVYLLSSLALPLLGKSSDPRVVFVSSGGMYTTKFPHWDTAAATNAQAKFDGALAYAYAKRGQVTESGAAQQPPNPPCTQLTIRISHGRVDLRPAVLSRIAQRPESSQQQQR